jgi:hypothetical protein
LLLLPATGSFSIKAILDVQSECRTQMIAENVQALQHTLATVLLRRPKLANERKRTTVWC